jgi:hypothetical protein
MRAGAILNQSSLVRGLGGPKGISNLPLVDQLFVYTDASIELGRMHAARKNADRAVREDMKERRYLHAAGMAKKYGLGELMREAARKAVEEDMGVKGEYATEHYQRAAETAKEYGLGELMREAALGLVELYIREGYCDDAEKTAKEYSLDENDVRRTVRMAVETAINRGCLRYPRGQWYSTAMIAKRYGFEEPMKRAALALVRYEMRERKSTRWIAEEFRLDENDMRQAAIERVGRDIAVENYLGAARTAKAYGLDRDAIKQAARNTVNETLDINWDDKRSNYLRAARIAREYGLKELMERAAGKAIEEEMGLAHYKDAAEIAREYGLKELMERAAGELVERKMWGRNYEDAARIANEYGLEEVLRQVVTKAVEEEMGKGHFEDAARIAREYDLEEVLRQAEIEIVESLIRYQDHGIAKESAKGFGLDESDLKRAAMSVAAEQILFRHPFYSAARTEREYGLDENDMKQVAAKAFEIEIEREHYENAAKIAKEYGLKELMRQAAAKAFENKIGEGQNEDAAMIAIEYSLDEKDMRQAARKATVEAVDMHIRSGKHEEARNTAEQYGLDEKEMEPLIMKVVDEYIEKGFFGSAARIAKEYGFEEVMMQAARKAVESYMGRGNYGYALTIAKEYGLREQIEILERLQSVLR